MVIVRAKKNNIFLIKFNFQINHIWKIFKLQSNWLILSLISLFLKNKIECLPLKDRNWWILISNFYFLLIFKRKRLFHNIIILHKILCNFYILIFFIYFYILKLSSINNCIVFRIFAYIWKFFKFDLFENFNILIILF